MVPTGAVADFGAFPSKADFELLSEQLNKTKIKNIKKVLFI